MASKDSDKPMSETKDDFRPASETATNAKINAYIESLTGAPGTRVRHRIQDAWNGSIGWITGAEIQDYRRPDHYAKIVYEELDAMAAKPEFAGKFAPATIPSLKLILWQESKAEWNAVPHLVPRRDEDKNPLFHEDGSPQLRPASRAIGGYQIIPANWSALADKYPDYIPTPPKDVPLKDLPDYWTPELQARAAFLLSVDDQAVLRRVQPERDFTLNPHNGSDLYGLHYSGATSMSKVATAKPDQTLSEIFSERVLSANNYKLPKEINADQPFFRDWTVAEFEQWRELKLTTHMGSALSVMASLSDTDRTVLARDTLHLVRTGHAYGDAPESATTAITNLLKEGGQQVAAPTNPSSIEDIILGYSESEKPDHGLQGANIPIPEPNPRGKLH